MRQQDLEILLRREPCPRLRLHMTGGQIFEISDPDQVVMSRTTVELLLPPGEEGEREAVINLLHIIWIEILPPPP
jgi:hypothetical protein